MITYMQHKHPSLAYYTSESHTFLRGAASTVDRDFGIIGAFFFHDVLDTHVLHHHMPSIPFYHAREATERLKEVIGQSYVRDTRSSFLLTFWNYFLNTRFVKESSKDSKVYYFLNK